MIATEKQAKPFLKWAGGKGQLLSQFQSFFPDELNGKGIIKRYYEPFLGSGAVFFWVMQNCKIKKAYINEFNSEIYMCYVVMKKNADRVIKHLQALQEEYYSLDSKKREAFYYQIRTAYNRTRPDVNFEKYDVKGHPARAAMTIFLNRTCFNGLYRVNSKGDFNVPFGRYKNPAICNAENIKKVNRLLQNVTITNSDFSVVRRQINNDSFVYFDPPYRPLSKTSNFTSYAPNQFDDSEQLRLARIFKELSGIGGVRIMLSNSDPKNVDPSDNFFDDLYRGYRIKRLNAARLINCNAARRGIITEILVMNY